MTTFCPVNDALLARMITAAQRRLIFIAPGLHTVVANALTSRFKELGQLQVTLVLDASEDVCRIGFGDIEALAEVHAMENAAGFSIRTQPGLRIGALIVDDETLVWAPTPRSVEAAPATDGEGGAMAPNGLLLDEAAGKRIAWAVAADGADLTLDQADIGHEAVTPTMVATVSRALANNPPIPVDLQRVTRVFSTRLQFVELEVKGAARSQRKLRLPNDLINADAADDVRDLLDSGFKPFADFKDRPVKVPVFADGKQAFDGDGNPLEAPATEASLGRERKALKAQFLYDIPGFGTLIEKDRKADFLKDLDTYKARMSAHAEGLRKLVEEEMDRVVEQIATLIEGRYSQTGQAPIDAERLRHELRSQVTPVDGAEPVVRCVFKDVTHEQTQDPVFRQRVDKALPGAVKRRLGPWYHEFSAARELAEVPTGGRQ
jgi:hypothetical protein